MAKYFLVILIIFELNGYSQLGDSTSQPLPFHLEFQDLNYRTQISNSQIYFADVKEVHSSVKPVISFAGDPEKSKLFYFKNVVRNQRSNYIKIYPLSDIVGGIEIGAKSKAVYTGGLGLGVDYSSNKFILSAKGLPYFASLGSRSDSIYNIYDQDIGTNRSITNNVFYRTELLMAFQANKFFTFSGGFGKNFFGEGYRSLLLSDNAAANPFLKIETSFAGIKYVNLYNFWRDNTVDPFNRKLDINKFSAIHYLSWNVTRDINLSIFETVVWSGNDTLVNRGFDINYINPIVFYRPVEYGLGSSDNVLLGGNISYKLNKHHNFYMQFILDEFLLKELKAQSRWWANKYGLQFGYKSDSFIKDSLYFQLEFNAVRPFTYSHKSSQHAYGNMNAPVAHPLGANFFELVNIMSYPKNKHRFTNKLVFASTGFDQDSISYGQDIFKSYKLRPGDFGQLMMQGVRTNILNETFIYEYAIKSEIDLYLMASYNWRMANNAYGTHHLHTFNIGIRSRIWNRYNDL
ncbi:MAG: hypothetical protein R2780_06100 [Crocinitomicaceae bacterium]|nr:hypothetical protein [Crocinitomicaceae bacterium]